MLKVMVDFRNVESLERDLDRFNERAFPNAVRATVNALSIDTVGHAQQNIQAKLTTRNEFTKRSIRYSLAKERNNINKMYSLAGSLSPYMREQETGFDRNDAVIPTAEAAGQGTASRRTLPKIKSLRLSSIKVGKRAELPERMKANPKQSLLVRLQLAAKSGNPVLMLNASDGMKREGIYSITGGQYTGHGFIEGAKLYMLYDMSKGDTTTKPHEWLEPSTDIVSRKRADIYRFMLSRQLQMERLFLDKKRK